MPARMAWAGRRKTAGRPSEQDLALRRLGARAEKALQQFGPARADQPGHAEDFAAAEGEVDVAEPPLGGVTGPGEREAAHLQNHLARRARLAQVGFFNLASHHQVRDFAGRGRGPGDGPHKLAVAEYGDAIGQAEDLVHLVGDIDDGGALAAEPFDDPKQPGRFGLGQRAGGLVHNEDVGRQRQGLGDFDELLVADAKLADRRAWGHLALELAEQLAGRPLHRPIVEQTEAAQLLASQEDVGGGRQLVDEVEFLVDHADAGPLAVVDAAEADRPAADEHLAFEVGDQARKALHERALAGAVLADDGVQFARDDVKRDVAERHDAGEPLGEAAKGNERIGCRGVHRCSFTSPQSL